MGSPKTIGWIGTGIMGGSMCRNLLKAGYAVRAYNRTPEKARALEDAGATACATIADAVSGADVVCTMVGYPADVREVYLADGGVLASLPSDAAPLCIDFTTSTPSLAVELAEVADRRGISALDAPVSGGDVGARNGTLAIMVGGSSEAFDAAKPILDVVGARVRRMGGPGAGQHTKMANQILVAGNMIGAVESLLYARRAGLDGDAVIDVIGSGAAGSWTINNLGPRITAGDDAPGFLIRHFIKDMGIALQEARAMRLALPGLALVEQLYEAAQAQGMADFGTQALIHVLDRLSSPR